MSAARAQPRSGADLTVGIDVGTTSTKAVVVDAEGNVRDRVRMPHPVRFPAAQRMEHDADRAWRRGPRRALAALDATGAGAVAVSTMVPSMTAVDRRGKPLTPGLLYGDERGGAQAEAMGFLRWTAGEAPDAHGYWPAPAVANFALAGEAAVDLPTAHSTTPLFAKGAWDAERCATEGIAVERLPRIVAPGSPIGRVHDSELTLAGGSIDAMCEQLVAGADEPGDVLVICGTTLITWATTSDAVQADGLYTLPHLAPGRYVVGGPSNAGGLFLNAVDRWLGGRRPPIDGVDPHDVPVWSPYIRGERTPLHDPHRRAQLHGLSLTHDAAAIRRAAYEAAGFVVRHHLDVARIGNGATRIVATGGGTRVPGWMQALADCTGLPVHVAAEPEGAAIGAAYLARLAIGRERDLTGAARWARTRTIVEPDPRWSEPATERYERFRALAADAGTP